MLRPTSLRARLVLGVIALGALGLAAADIATYTSLRSFLFHRVDSTLQAAHPIVEGNVFGRRRGGSSEESGPVGAMGRLVASLYAAMQTEEWERLKLCNSDTCRWAFFDRSKNHSSRWCTMASCGNREKARRFRQKGTASSAPARG